MTDSATLSHYDYDSNNNKSQEEEFATRSGIAMLSITDKKTQKPQKSTNSEEEEEML